MIAKVRAFKWMGVHLKQGQERGQVSLLTSFSVLHVITIVPSHPKQFALTLRFSWHVERFADYPPAPLNQHLSGHSVVPASLITLDPFYSEHTPLVSWEGIRDLPDHSVPEYMRIYFPSLEKGARVVEEGIWREESREISGKICRLPAGGCLCRKGSQAGKIIPFLTPTWCHA